MQPSVFERLAKLTPERMQLLKQLQDQARSGKATTIDDAQPFPLASGQLRIWRAIQQDATHCLHQLVAVLDLRGELRSEIFHQALQTVVRKNPALRTQFIDSPDGIRQQIASEVAASVPLQTWDLSHLTGIDQQLAMQQRISHARLAPLDLQSGLPWRILLLRLAPTQWKFVLVIHHLVCDGWSLGIVQREICQAYDRALLHSENSSDAAGQVPGPSLARHVAQEQAWLSTDECRDQRAYWADVFRTPLPGLRLPYDPGEDVAEPPVPGSNSRLSHVGPARTARRRLSSAISSDILRLARDADMTPAVIVLSAWNILLAAVTQESEVCLGVPYANRDWPGGWEQVGMLANTLPLRTSLAGNPSFLDLAARTRTALLDGTSHGKLPLEEILASTETQQRPAIAAALSIMFVWQSAWELGSTATYYATGIDLSQLVRTDSDLVLNVAPSVESLDFLLVYRADRFHSSVLEGWLENLEMLLCDVIRSPEKKIQELSWASSRQVHELAAWSQGSDEEAIFGTVVERIQAAASENGQLTALESTNHEAVSYHAMLTEIEIAAKALLALGIHSEEVIPILLPRSPALVTSMLSVLTSGGAFMVLDPAYPDERLNWLMQHTAARFVITDAESAIRVPDGVQALSWQEVRSMSEVRLANGFEKELPRLRGDQLAYVISTSGSTGEPKLVEIEHAGLLNHALEFARRLRLAPGTRISHTLASSFDASLQEIFPALIAGGTLVIHPEPRDLAIPQLIEFIRTWEIHVLHMVATIFAPFAEFLASPQADLDYLARALSKLRVLATGGDTILSSSARVWSVGAARHVELLFVYGVTEASITSTASRVTTTDLAGERLPIGRPIGQHDVWILDCHGKQVPAGGNGEMWIGGIGVARGYRGLPALTAERFQEVRLPGIGTRRLYRSGDRGRWRYDGQLEFLGRVDEQAKVRGWRVEPGEVQAALSAIPAVAESRVVVQAAASDPARKQLVAYVVTRTEHTWDRDAIRRQLRQLLPPHLIPAVILPISVFPRLPNGKIDDAALPPLHTMRRDTATADPSAMATLPQSPAEVVFNLVWSELLEIPPSGIDDDFFELGGDSILAMQVVHRVRQQGWDISPSQVFTHPTIRELASIAVLRPSQNRIYKVPRIGCLGPAQQMFFGWSLAVPKHFYQAILLEMPKEWTQDVVAAAWEKVCTHHAVLGSRFQENGNTSIDGGWQQVFGDSDTSGNSRFHAVDLMTVADDDLESQLQHALGQSLSRIDHQAGPISVAMWIHLPHPRSPALLLAAHHLVVDGVSWRIIVEDLEQACQQIMAGESIDLGDVSAPYAVWAELRAQKSSTRPATSSAHTVGSAAALEFANSAIETAELDPESTTLLLTSAHVPYRTHVDDLLFAAVAHSATQHLAIASLRIDWERHGRDQLGDAIDVHRTVGWFTEVLPLTFDFSRKHADTGIPDLVPRVKETLRRAVQTARDKGPLQALAADPAILSLNYLGQFRATTGVTRFRPESMDPSLLTAPTNRRSHPLELIAYVADGRLQLRFTYALELLQSESAHAFLERTVVELKAILAHCQEPTSGALTASDIEGERLSMRELASVNALPSRDIAQIFGLTSVQQMMLLHAVAHPQDATLREQVTMRICGHIDTQTLKIAWQKVLQRHDMLRTHFVWQGLRSPLQVTRRHVQLPWREVDFSNHTAELADRAWRDLADEELRSPIDLGQAPLLRIAVAKKSSSDINMSFVCHHAVLDGWSLPLLLGELFEAYERGVGGFGEGRGERDSPSFRHFVEWTRQRDTALARAWFKAELTEPIRISSIAATLHGSTNTSPARVNRYGECDVQIAADWLHRVEQAARVYRVSLGSMLMTAWGYVVSATTGRDDFCMGVTVAGRPEGFPGVDRLLGPLAHLLPLRFRWKSRQSLVDTLRDVHSRSAQLVHHSHVSIAEVAEWSPSLGGVAIPAAFVLENYPLPREMRGTSISIDEIEGTVSATVPWMLAVFPGESPKIRCRYREGLCSQEGAARLISLWERLLTDWSQPELGVEDENTPAHRIVEKPYMWRKKIETTARHDQPNLFPDEVNDGELIPSDKQPQRAKPLVPPQSWTQQQLVRIWKEVLGTDEIGIEDPFPELGGTSLQAMQLLDRVQQTFGRRLPLLALYAEPTIAEHARLLEMDDCDEDVSEPSLVPLRPGGNAQPLFCIHPAGGTVFCYADFARQMPPQHAIWGVQARGVGGRSTPVSRVEAMAADYVQEIIAAQSQGPYAVCGWSSGGVIAYEVARQLAELGSSLSLVAVCDTAVRTDGHEYSGDDIVAMLSLMFPDIPPELLLELRGGDEVQVIEFFRQRALRVGLITEDGTAQHLAAVYEVFKSNARAVAAYQLKPVAFDLLVVRAASEATQMHHDPLLGWGGLARSVEVITVPGDHISMFHQPVVNRIAEIIAARLR